MPSNESNLVRNLFSLLLHIHLSICISSSSSSSRSHLVVGSLRQTQFSSSQFCHGRRSDGSHVSVDTVHASLLRSSSFSSPGWCHLQSLSSDVVLVSPLYMSKPHQSCFPAPLCDVLYLQSLSDVIVSHMNLHLIYPYFFPVVAYSFTNLTLEIYLEFVPDKI